MVRVRQVLAVGACALALVACSTDKAEPAGITAAATPTGSPTPTASSTPDEIAATDLSDPELGIVFVDTPDLTGPEASAHDAVAIFRKEHWRSQQAGTLSAVLPPLISPTLQEKVEYGLQRNRENGWTVGGTLKVTISDVTIDDTSASATVCLDYSEVDFHKDGGEAQRYDAIGFVQYERSTVSLSTMDGGTTWRPEDFTAEGNSCRPEPRVDAHSSSASYSH